MEGKPVIVLSNSDGCAISISDEAKVLGIKMAVPVQMVADVIKKNNIAVFSSNYTLYGDMSDRVMSTIKEFAPQMEVYSIEETFLNLEGIPLTQLDDLGKKIKATVRKYTGIPGFYFHINFLSQPSLLYRTLLFHLSESNFSF